MNIAALLPKAQAGATAVAGTNPNPSNAPTLGANAPDATPLDQVIASIGARTTPATTNPASTAFDPQYEQTVNTINQGLAGLQSSSDLAKQRNQEDYDTAVGTAGKNNQDALKSINARLGAQGIGYSGINVAEQGKQGENYQTLLGQLSQGKQRTFEDITRSLTAQQADFANQKAQADIDRGNRATTAAQQQAADDAAAASAKNTGDLNRDFLNSITTQILSAVQPSSTPTGQMALPPTNPQQIVQAAIAAVPPPAAKTPQQQAVEAGIDPKYLQNLLSQHGFNPGPIDGVMGLKTQQALARWKQSMGLPATADINQDILTQLLSPMPAGLGGAIAHRGGAQA